MRLEEAKTKAVLHIPQGFRRIQIAHSARDLTPGIFVSREIPYREQNRCLLELSAGRGIQASHRIDLTCMMQRPSYRDIGTGCHDIVDHRMRAP